MNVENNSLDKQEEIKNTSENFTADVDNVVNNDDVNSKDNYKNDELENLHKEIENLNSDLLNQKLLTKNNLKLYKMRIEKKIDQTYKFSLKDFIYSLFPVIDSIEFALRLFNKNDEIVNSTFMELEKVFQSFINLLTKYGITVVNEINIPFNPDVHQAITMQLSNRIKENHVISIMQKGYLLYDRLLRPAMVVVSQKHN